MAYDATKPKDDGYLSAFPAEMREQLRAIVQDAIVNALTVKGYSPGNLNGNIPVSNGNLNTNLNADKLDGHDATYFSANDHVHAAATQSTNGFMSNTDKAKLDGVAAGAEVNQNTFSNVAVGTETIQADSKTDTLTLAAGANIALTPDGTNNKVTIGVTGTVPAAVADAAGNVIINTYLPKSGGVITGNINWTGEKLVYNSNAGIGFYASDTATGFYDWKKRVPVIYYVQNKNTIDLGNASTVTTFAGTVNAPTFSGHLVGTADNATNADNATHATTADNATHATTADKLNSYTVAQLIGETSYATNGYHKFPDGTIIQWGTFSATSIGYATISFPIAFPTGCLNVQKTSRANGDNAGEERYLRSWSSTGFRTGYDNAGCTWLAIGY